MAHEAGVESKRWLSRPRILLVLLFLTVAGLQYRTLFLGSLINADPTQRVWLHLDEATVNYDAARIASGQVMYRDFFQFQGPVHYYLYAGLFGVVGRSFQAARVLTVLSVSLSACLLALLLLRILGRDRRGHVIACSAAVIHAAGFVPTWTATYPHWTAELLLLAGLYLATGVARGRATYVTAGALIATGLWTILSLGLPALITALVVSLIVERGERFSRLRDRPSVQLALGAAGVTTFIVVGFALAGGLSELVYANFVWPFGSYGKGQTDLSGYASYFGRTVNNHAALGFPWSMFGLVLAEATRRGPQLAFLGVLPALWILARFLLGRGPELSPRRPYLLMASVAAACVSPLVLGVSRADMTHLAFVGSFGLLGLGAAVSLLATHRKWALACTLVFGLSAAMILVNHISMHFWSNRDPQSWESYIRADPTSRKILAHLKPGDLLFDTEYFSGLRYFYLADSASPITFVPHSGQSSYYTKEQWAWIAEELERKRPRVINTDAAMMSLLSRHAPGLASRYARGPDGLFVLKPAP